MQRVKMNRQELINHYHALIMARMQIQEQLDQEIKHYSLKIEKLKSHD